MPQKRSCAATSPMETALLVRSAASSIPRRESVLPLPHLHNTSSIGTRFFCRNYSLSLTSKELRKRCHGGCRRGPWGHSSLTRTRHRQPPSCSPSLTVPLRNRSHRLGDPADERNSRVDISFGLVAGVRLQDNVDCKFLLYVPLRGVLIRSR